MGITFASHLVMRGAPVKGAGHQCSKRHNKTNLVRVSLEEKIARVVAGRIQSMKEMIGDDTETLREIEDLLHG